MKKLIFSLFALLAVLSNLNAQNFKQDQRSWFAYTGQYKVSNHWGVHIESQFRLDNEWQKNLQNLYRFGGIYYIDSNKALSGGYAFVTTFSSSVNEYYNENRTWEQFQYTSKWNQNKETMVNRVRFENRWVEKLELIDGFVKKKGVDFQNRLRYLNRNLFHLVNLKGSGEIYFVVQDELFFSIGSNKINTKVIDQNRFQIGLGLSYNSSTRLEIGYLNQYITSGKADDVMNHTISLSLSQNLNLY